MRAIECPNCYARVVLLPSGLCPACNRSPDAPSADATRTKVTVWKGLELPPVCFGCGTQTDAMMVIRRASSSEAIRYGRMILSTLALPFVFVIAPLRLLLLNSIFQQGPFSVVRVKIPCCDACKAQRLPKQDWIDFHEGTISLIVPKIVAERIPKR